MALSRGGRLANEAPPSILELILRRLRELVRMKRSRSPEASPRTRRTRAPLELAARELRRELVRETTLVRVSLERCHYHARGSSDALWHSDQRGRLRRTLAGTWYLAVSEARWISSRANPLGLVWFLFDYAYL